MTHVPHGSDCYPIRQIFLDGPLEVGFLLIWQLVLVESGDSRPTDCPNHRKQGTRGNVRSDNPLSLNTCWF